MTTRADVAIVGGGIGGAVAALGFGREGRRVVVIERGLEPRLNGADVLKPAGIKVLVKYGLLDLLLERGARKRTKLRIYHDRELVDELNYADDPSLLFFVLIPYRTLLTTVLEILGTMKNVEIRYGTGIRSIEPRGSTIERMHLTSDEVVEASVFVGADGVRSVMREHLGIQVERETYEQKMYFGKFPMVPSVEEVNRLYVDSKKGLAYFYPVGHDFFRAVLAFPEVEGRTLRAAADPEPLRRRLKEFVSESDDAVAAVDNLDVFDEIPIGRMHAPAYGAGNVALLGDSIHNVHPITGQGMNMSIEDAGALVEHVERFFTDGVPISDCVAGYFKERSPINRAVVAYGHNMATSFHDRELFSSTLNLRIQASSRDLPLLEQVGAREK
jgi:HQNO biosynthesis monooxygenase PqsL